LSKQIPKVGQKGKVWGGVRKNSGKLGPKIPTRGGCRFRKVKYKKGTKRKGLKVVGRNVGGKKPTQEWGGIFFVFRLCEGTREI